MYVKKFLGKNNGPFKNKDGCSLCTCLMRVHIWSITTEPTPNGKLTKHFIVVKLLYFYCISTI